MRKSYSISLFDCILSNRSFADNGLCLISNPTWQHCKKQASPPPPFPPPPPLSFLGPGIHLSSLSLFLFLNGLLCYAISHISLPFVVFTARKKKPLLNISVKASSLSFRKSQFCYNFSMLINEKDNKK